MAETEKEDIPPYALEEAIAEAQRCLKCPKPLCRTGCPIENDIPAFNRALSSGNIGEAYAIISERSNLPAICGHICPHENQCQGHCIMNRMNKPPILIGQIERFIANFEAEFQLNKIKKLPKTAGKVAVIGSGGDVGSNRWRICISCRRRNSRRMAFDSVAPLHPHAPRGRTDIPAGDRCESGKIAGNDRRGSCARFWFLPGGYSNCWAGRTGKAVLGQHHQARRPRPLWLGRQPVGLGHRVRAASREEVNL